MGKIIKKRIEYGGSSNSAENIKYDDTKNVKEAINEVDNLLGNTDISAIGDGTVTGGLNALNSNLSNKIIYQEYDVTTASNPNVALGNLGSVTITKDGYTPISAYPNDDVAYQGFCNLRHYLDGTSVVMMMSTSERTFRIRVWYKKD